MAKTEEKKTNAFGLTKEEAESVKDFKPTLNLGTLEVGQSKRLKVLSEEPREVEREEEVEEDGETKTVKKKDLVIECVDADTGMECTVWLSSKSLRMEFYKVYKNAGTLKNIDVIVGVREYKHEKYGKSRGYTVQQDLNPPKN